MNDKNVLVGVKDFVTALHYALVLKSLTMGEREGSKTNLNLVTYEQFKEGQ